MSTDGNQPPSIRPHQPTGAHPARTSAARTTTKPQTTRVVDKSGGRSLEDTGELSAPIAARADPASLPKTEPAALPREKAEAPRKDSASTPAVERKPATGTTTGQGTTPGGPRRVRLAVARVDPWSVMKLSFLVSVGVGIMIVVAAAVVWLTLDGLHVFAQVNETIAEITADPEFFDVFEYLALDRVVSLATMIAVVDIVLLTALATISAFLYNIVAALVGGIHVTLTDD